MIARRLAGWIRQTIEWLRVAAVIGRDFDAALLEQLLANGRGGVPATRSRRRSRLACCSSRRVRSGPLQLLACADPGDAVRGHVRAAPRADPPPRGRGARGRRASASAGALSPTTSRAPPAPRTPRRRSRTRRAPREQADRDARPRGGGRALRARARGARAVRARGRAPPLRAAAAARRGAGARRGAPAGVGRRSARRATLAERLGDSASLARAAIGASRRYVQEPGVVDAELIALLERALEHDPRRAHDRARAAAGSPVRRALLLAGARPDGGAERGGDPRSPTELDDPEASAHAAGGAPPGAVGRRRTSSERLATSTEMLTLAPRGRATSSSQLQAHAWLVVDLLEHGDRDAVDAQIAAFTRRRRASSASRCTCGTRWSGGRCARCSPGASSEADELAARGARGRVARRGHDRAAVLRDAAAGDPPRAGPDGGARAGGPASMVESEPAVRRGAPRWRRCCSRAGRLDEARAELDLLPRTTSRTSPATATG